MIQDKKLLIVEDEADACLLMARLLRHKFAHIECSFSLAEALGKAALLQPDVVLLDNNLPDGCGIDHISAFKNFSRQEVKVVVISALDIRSEAMAAGADDFIGKPLAVADLQW